MLQIEGSKVKQDSFPALLPFEVIRLQDMEAKKTNSTTELSAWKTQRSYD